MRLPSKDARFKITLRSPFQSIVHTQQLLPFSRSGAVLNLVLIGLVVPVIYYAGAHGSCGRLPSPQTTTTAAEVYAMCPTNGIPFSDVRRRCNQLHSFVWCLFGTYVVSDNVSTDLSQAGTKILPTKIGSKTMEIHKNHVLTHTSIHGLLLPLLSSSSSSFPTSVGA